LHTKAETTELEGDTKLPLQQMLCIAASNCQVAIMRELLDDGGQDSTSLITPEAISHAITGGLEAYQVLYEYDPSVIHRDLGHGDDALGQATLKEDSALVSFLLSKGVDPKNSQYFGRPTLEAAAGHSTKDIVTLLLGSGAGIEVTNALLAAVWNSRPDTLKVLLEKGVDVNEILNRDRHFTTEAIAVGAPPLHVAVSRGEQECVKLLLHYGADPFKLAVDGSTAAGRAAQAKNAKVISMIDQREQGKLGK
jgi:ankyrin repeat protein